MATVRSQLTNLMKVDMDKILQENWKGVTYEPILNTLFNTDTSGKKDEQNLTVGGFGLLDVKDEGVDMAERLFKEGYKTTYTHKTLAFYAAVSMEARDDEQYGAIRKIPQAMTKSVDATINRYMARIFGLSTSTTDDFITGGDGVALLSTAHPLKISGGTFSNKPSTDADLTATTMWAGVNAFYEMLDDAGKPIANSPKYLVVPHQTQQKAIELVFSEKFPESAENAINALRKAVNLELVVWPYWLGSIDADCWFLCADKSATTDYPLRFYWRTKPMTEADTDFFNKNWLYSLVMRMSLGYDDPRFIYGSVGA